MLQVEVFKMNQMLQFILTILKHKRKQFKLLSRQYVIYYVCINSRDKFNEKLLLSKESFYSDLNKYQDLHRIVDVLLSSGVFEKYRKKNTHKRYDLHPVRSIKLPSLQRKQKQNFNF